MMPNTQLPSTAPIEKYEPIHDVSDRFNGPDSNGESFDCKNGSAGDSHPMAQPWHRVMMFAAKLEKIQN